MNLLAVRNDKLGDLLVTLPALACIKKNLPESTITLLARDYTSEVAQRCQYIDEVLVDPGREKGFGATLRLSRSLKDQKFDSVPYRLAPATKLAQLAYNHRLTQRRSQSIKPEYEYNLDLAKKFLADMNVDTIESPEPPYLTVSLETQQQTRSEFFASHRIPVAAKLVFVHAGSGGSSNNLSLEQYAKFIKYLEISEPYHFILSAGPGELDYVNRLSGMIDGIPHAVYESKEGLTRFVEHISLAHLFIGGSTGPLHIAGAAIIPPKVPFHVSPLSRLQ